MDRHGRSEDGDFLRKFPQEVLLMVQKSGYPVDMDNLP